MKRLSLHRTSHRIGALLATLISSAGTAQGQPEPTFAGIETVGQITNASPSGVAVTRRGRIFLSFPRDDAHTSATLAEYRGGLISPYPNASWSLPGDSEPAKRFISASGITLDASGQLWVLDSGKEAGKPMQPGAAKVVGINVARNDVFATVPLRNGAALPTSRLSQVRVDLTHGVYGTAFVSDSSLDHAALLVIDLATGQSRRIFEHSRFTTPDTHFMTYVENVPHRYDGERATMPQGGVDGIELSADSKRLYWTALSGRQLFSAPTAVLAKSQATPAELEHAVRDEGERPTTVGLTRDAQGRLYFGAFDQRGIIRRNADATFTVVQRDPRLTWADALFIANDYVYATLGQSNRMASLNNGRDARQPPYLLVRFRLRNTTASPLLAQR